MYEKLGGSSYVDYFGWKEANGKLIPGNGDTYMYIRIGNMHSTYVYTYVPIYKYIHYMQIMQYLLNTY